MFRIWNDKPGEFENPPDKVTELNEFLSQNRYGFIFCAPQWYDTLTKLPCGRDMDKVFGGTLNLKKAPAPPFNTERSVVRAT
jgi:hypothetical protein